MKKKTLFTCICFVLVLLLAVFMVSCGQNPTVESATNSSSVEPVESISTEVPSAAASNESYPKIDLNSTEVFGSGPDGAPGVDPSALELTEEEIAKLKEGKFKVAICHHMLSNQVNQAKSAATQKTLKDLGIEVVAVTDADFSVDKLVSDLETVMALDPDVIISMPLDADATASTYKKIHDAGIKLVFQENPATGLVPGKDYECLVNPDSYGHGKYAAEIMAEKLGYKGKVGMIIFDVPFFCTNERDRGFKETMANYPDIEIVDVQGFTDMGVVGTVADGLFASHPDLNGCYVSWEAPCVDAVTSAQSAGLTNIIFSTSDLGEGSAAMIARGGPIVGSGVPLSYETGIAEAMAAANILLGKEIPTYVTTHSNAVVKENVSTAYTRCFSIDPPPALAAALKEEGLSS